MGVEHGAGIPISATAAKFREIVGAGYSPSEDKGYEELADIGRATVDLWRDSGDLAIFATGTLLFSLSRLAAAGNAEAVSQLRMWQDELLAYLQLPNEKEC